jgi:starch phosphorylase
MSPFFYQALPEGLDKLSELALDLRWTWSHEGDRLWSAIDPEVWDRTQNPWLMLQIVSHIELQKLLRDRVFMGELRYLLQSRKDYLEKPGWFRQHYPDKTLNTVAYFSMEFGLAEALPLYAGGLGILAGGYLKTASDLQVPLVGIGILYQEGYFRQMVDSNGWQIEAYPYNDPTSLPIRPVTDADGGWMRLSLEMPGRTLWLRVWQARVGGVMLYLLDSNDPLNSSTDRGITNKLYDDRSEIRLMQEMILGMGGWRVVDALGLPVEICHLNEGHAAFLVLERARSYMAQTGASLSVALCATRAGNVFTTHTPVAAGFDSFPPQLVAHYFRDYAQATGASPEQILALGRKNPDNPQEPFNMAYLATRGSGCVNGVSQLHARVSRRIFQPLYRRWPEAEVPVGYITNGVHVPSWDSQFTDELWTKAGGKERWLHELEDLAEQIQQVSDKELWTFRTGQCRNLIEFVRQRLAYQLSQHGASDEKLEEAHRVLDTDALILGFARRFTSYKRPNLLLTDPARLESIINNPARPLQLVVAGKAHPDDVEGKRLVQQFVSFASRLSVRHRVAFIEDYDMAIAQELVQGVDLWLNTPRRPWEACGTSGMKVLVNGGLNFSELDGWWAEAYSPDVGWALGDGREHPEPGWDITEANQLYDTLEQEIIPEFYDRDKHGVPTGWVARMRASMARLAPRFSSNRMLRQYVEEVYLPMTNRFRQRQRDGARLARELCQWQYRLGQDWPDVRFGEAEVHLEDKLWKFMVKVYLGKVAPSSVSVELYANPLNGQEAVCIPMVHGQKIEEASNGYIYHGETEATRPAADFTLRIIPAHPSLVVPLEAPHILWQK